MKHSLMHLLYSIVYLLLILPCTIPFTSSLFAETGYVSDMLILTVREGPARSFNIISTLRSNAAVKILEKKGSYFKVKMESGDQGWVESRYISPELPKTIIIDRLKPEIEQLKQLNASLEQKNAPLKKQNADIKKQNVDLEKQNTDLVNKNTELTSKLQTIESSNIIQREEEYQKKIKSLEADLNLGIDTINQIELKLKQSGEQYQQLVSNSENIVQITKENEKLRQENQILSEEKSFIDIFLAGGDDVLKTAMIKWFLAGAGVLIAGWLIGRGFAGGSKRRQGLLA